MNYFEKILQHAFANSPDVLRLTQRLCNQAIMDNIPGDFVEAGCAYGVHGIVMKDISVKQNIILYDSFEGISVHGPEDIEWTEAHGVSVADPRKSGGITVAKIEHVKDTMLKFLPNLNGIEFRKGWFVDTFQNIPEGEIYSVLRLDCDLYDPYMLCFKYLWPRLSYGGWLIVDDYHLSGCKKAIVDSGLDLNDFIKLGETGNAYLQKGLKAAFQNSLK